MNIKILEEYINHCSYWNLIPTFEGLKNYNRILKELEALNND